MSDDAHARTEPRRSRALLVAIAVVVLGLLLTAQERTFGSITDEQQAIGTAVSLAESGSLGLPRGFAFAIPRERGDALSPYGLAMPLALVPACLAAESWERRFGAGSSQSLLVLVPLAFVALAALAAGLVARGLGATATGEVIAAIGTGLCSPLWPLGSTAFSEPLQAAALAGSLAAALLSARARAGSIARRADALALGAGALAGIAVLAKSMNLAVAPWCLAPLVVGAPSVRAALRSAMPAACGAAPVLGGWLAAEIARFGAPLASYSGQPFSHPLLDGLWRLTIGVNEGLFLYFPLAILALPGLVALSRQPALRAAALAIAAACLTVLLLVSAWWAWDGSAGWGPRLLAPLVPLLAGAAGSWAGSRCPLVATHLLVAGAVVNLLGLLQPDASILLYVDSCGPVLIRDDEAKLWPAGLRDQFPPGQRRISRSMASVAEPSFSAIRVHAGVLWRRSASDTAEERLADLVANPPWKDAHPEAIPHPGGLQGQLSGVLFNQLVSAPSWPHWGACLLAEPVERRTGFVSAWLDALDDQVSLGLDVGDWRRALDAARQYFAIAQHDRAAALLAEALRASGRPEDCSRWLEGLPERTLEKPEGLAVRALLARDEGREDEARRLLETLASGSPSSGVRRALGSPLGEWPATIRPLIDSSAPWR